jgi:hypothetical protein
MWEEGSGNGRDSFVRGGARPGNLLKKPDVLHPAGADHQDLSLSRQKPLLATATECRAGTKLVKFDDRISELASNIDEARRHRDPKLLGSHGCASAKLTKSPDNDSSGSAIRKTLEASGETLVPENHNRLRRESKPRNPGRGH